jgi:hypothetical protein
MATCPRCGGHLHEHHRCRALWRLRLRVFATLLIAGVGSGLAVGLLFFLVYGRVSWLSISLAAAGGVAVQRALQIGEP